MPVFEPVVVAKTFPPPPPKHRTNPLPKGSIVTGFNHNRLFGFPGHKDHGLFRVDTDPTPVEWSNSGYQQDVTCYLCGCEILMVDSEFLMIKAKKVDIQREIRNITKLRNHLLSVRRQLIEEGIVK